MNDFIVELNDRAILKISGADAEEFLNGLFTCETLAMSEGEARFGALLTPQGKILFDFFVVKSSDQFLIDVKKEVVEEFAKRLMFYRLRKSVNIELDDSGRKMFAIWGAEPAKSGSNLQFVDPRAAAMGSRVIGSNMPINAEASYTNHRIELGMPEGGTDYEFSTTFPHEALMDQFGGVDFKKGCYVGQEVVSRMQHRGTARKRFLKISSETDLPPLGTQITGNGKPIGTMGSVSGSNGLALVRMDRAKAALDVEAEITAGELTVVLSIPDWAEFTWPEKDTS